MTLDIVSAEEAAAVKSAPRSPGKGRPPSPLAVAVMQGNMVFLPGAKHHSIGTTRSLPRKSGYRVYSRRGERNGVAGLFVWAEK